MNMKKILAITIIAMAVFSSMNAASAGWFDFLGGSTNNATFTFDGFTLDLPENAKVSNKTLSEEGYEENIFEVEWSNDDNSTDITVATARGSEVVRDIDEFVSNWVDDGAKIEESYGNWSVINVNGVPIENFTDYNLNYTGYVLAQHTGSELIVIRGEDLGMLKNIVDTFKKV